MSVSLPPRLSRGPLASHNEVADHRGPQGEASTEVSLQCGQVDHGGDTRSESPDIEMSADDDFNLADQRGYTEVSYLRGDTEVSLPAPPSSFEEEEDVDDDDKFTLVRRKRRKHDEPVSPSAAEPRAKGSEVKLDSSL